MAADFRKPIEMLQLLLLLLALAAGKNLDADPQSDQKAASNTGLGQVGLGVATTAAASGRTMRASDRAYFTARRDRSGTYMDYSDTKLQHLAISVKVKASETIAAKNVSVCFNILHVV
jgi:hypothetical protein